MKFFDTTLRDGEQTPGVSLTADKKLWIAKALDKLGVDVIEAGAAVTSAGERAAIHAVAHEGLRAEICSFARALRGDIDYCLACDVDSVHLVVPVSDLHIEKKLRKDRETVLRMAVDTTQYAVDHGLIVELSAEDASRADHEFLLEFYRQGVSAGATRLCFCDTVGVLVPDRTEALFAELSRLGPISIHCHDDFGVATANSLAALRGGATQVHVTVNGLGERAGNAALEEVVLALQALYHAKTRITTRELYPVSRLVSRLTGVPIAHNKPIVGENAFTHESGIHTHGLLADTRTYEPITPEMVGRERRIVLGKHAGSASVHLALQELGLDASEEQLSDILKRIKELGDKGKRITDADLQAIADAVLEINREARIKLEELTVVSGNIVTPTSSIKLSVDNQEVVEAGVGLGPVDAAINALRKAMGKLADITLEEYHVDSITGGTDALVEVWVKLSRDGHAITARGARADIIMASVEAVVEGVNRLLPTKE
ncbi:MAG: (R)-citramalate synthase [Halobacteriota archaeon]